MCKHFNELYAEFRKAGWSDLQSTLKDRGSSNWRQMSTNWSGKDGDYITQKFDEFEKYRHEKEAIIAILHSDSSESANIKVEDVEKKLDRQEKYSRRNCILIQGLKEEKKESNDDRVLKSFR